MQLARIDGNIVSTISHPSLQGWRTVICQPLDSDGKDDG
ncbi:MAG: ethanolamine utilization protein EutN, partial [Opitutaceae bacterium]|nr:ethanolamine utilization protein EutN [Opitutaceae bacterium]